jgi:uncharacterized membrane protein (UPF0127 family)
MKSKQIILIIVLALGILAGYVIQVQMHKNDVVAAARPQIEVEGQLLDIEIADTPAEREKGLSGRTSLAENKGLLFIFEYAGQWGFWMKEMKFPIDMIWLGKDLKVVDVKKNVAPDTYPEVFLPAGDALYVLETKAGFSAKNHIGTGTQFILKGVNK